MISPQSSSMILNVLFDETQLPKSSDATSKYIQAYCYLIYISNLNKDFRQKTSTKTPWQFHQSSLTILIKALRQSLTKNLGALFAFCASKGNQSRHKIVLQSLWKEQKEWLWGNLLISVDHVVGYGRKRSFGGTVFIGIKLLNSRFNIFQSSGCGISQGAILLHESD